MKRMLHSKYNSQSTKNQYSVDVSLGLEYFPADLKCAVFFV